MASQTLKFTGIKTCLLLMMGCFLAAATSVHADINTGTIEKMASAQVTIERLRKQKTPDWEKIRAKYDVIAPLVQETDRKKGLTYDQEIRAAIDRCAAGDKPKVNMQILAKGLQHVVVLNIRDELETMEDTGGGKIAALFEGIRPTFTRRDKDFYKAEPTLEKAADDALQSIRKSKGDLPMTAQMELNNTIDRTYGLCVLYEIIKVEKLRDSDPAACEVKVKEAEIFYRIIQPRIAKYDARAHEVVGNMLAASYDQMNAAELENWLNKGLQGITLR